ncbi:transcriptional regulator [Actinokineospora auranticolor]|uniref:Helix-turn-helix protein n=1 Tax=Actinokineospora auranticolor TaxID=155976 RepID=A0A2S6GXH4_9PSEU|nr:transcriptional regulator [Actinokineospora auranticolor]PPK69870.1 hypothetical protein CLV40_103480 [Actinokineospora auranticolor]
MSTWGDPHERPAAEVWEHPDMRAALSARDITQVYRLLRGRGVSQRRISMLTGQAQPEISAIARGRQVQTYDVLSRIADGLGVPRGYMGLAYGGQVRPATDEVVTTVPDRREFMGILAKITMGAALTGADLALLSSPAVATPTPRSVGATEVGQLRELTRVLWTQEKRLGGGAVRDAVIAQLRWAQAMLGANHTDEQGRELRVVLSDLLALAGWASYDVGLTGAALRYTGQALAVAQEAADPIRAALALEQIGRTYLHSGNLEEAREVFALGTLTAERARSTDATAMLLSSQARAYATLGHPTQALDYMTRAEDSLARIDTPTIPDPRGFNEAHLTSDRGRLYTTLAVKEPHYADQAIATLSTFASQANTIHTKRLAFRLTELATTHLHGGDTATGIRIGHEVLDMAATIRSKRLTEHLQLLRAATRANPAADAKELHHRITTLA